MFDKQLEKKQGIKDKKQSRKCTESKRQLWYTIQLPKVRRTNIYKSKPQLNIFANDYVKLYLREMVKLHGVPVSIISNRGTQFTSTACGTSISTNNLNGNWHIQYTLTHTIHPVASRGFL